MTILKLCNSKKIVRVDSTKPPRKQQTVKRTIVKHW